MASFGSSKRNVFKPTAYGNTRRPRRIPRWMVLMLTGIVLGAGGLLFLQKSYGPTRLTVEQSEQLHNDLNSANLDKQRLQSQLNQATHDLNEAKSSLSSQSAQLKAAQEQVVKTNNDLQLFADAMPPDPRGTSPGIRSATFKNNAGQLDYQILVMQDDNKKATTYNGQLELVVAGRYANGKSNTITLPPMDVSLQQYTYVRGSLPLPETFTARQVTIRITDQNSKHISATRTLRVLR
ncbi:hypothetical protein LSG25_07955 [Paralcaligenes sp. KSB-10]|uniref:DUF6776 family protein n=1 Tax=Paralcaligenes sp. KSB-10 TaxID=2901142 RepID=UPI001E442287|nr:DUF6776 family protein [Paralcaligenes sp. KSB-10]UHL65796.1 hypothetical protein LSG25_07955 [Paralcaligenes sp. KSB-10]